MWNTRSWHAKCSKQPNHRQKQNFFPPLHIKLGLMKQSGKACLCFPWFVIWKNQSGRVWWATDSYTCAQSRVYPEDECYGESSMADLWRCQKELSWKQKGTKLWDSCVQDALCVSWFRMQNEHQSPFFVQPPGQIPRKPWSHQWQTGGVIPPGPHDSRRMLPRLMGPIYDGWLLLDHQMWLSSKSLQMQKLQMQNCAHVAPATIAFCALPSTVLNWLPSFFSMVFVLKTSFSRICRLQKCSCLYFSHHLVHIHL